MKTKGPSKKSKENRHEFLKLYLKICKENTYNLVYYEKRSLRFV